ncbi:fimbria/pilus periplasmic chaperone [Burkholderia pseudomultivorans]|uniref:Fimbrial chaperone YadV n=1 Tax=Burkholderia pseudomultivorans TaxID=1207504 RepID=A0ABU2E5W1_9BURK|nr:putative fimbrial chaperone YadV [Burkholderia pseudomultivorans]MDR8737789.1 putative fimbrial chaperone YadV [Burkholderia pseudomultivorans]MDR8743937.1 putative fimbrial chaperone YadV [Burkholderia pseudomultivorans]MDR8755262.1 putative fimbrial chaperone YadV [Burkholderia pseudomultivorans]MDR8780387.1 putative fimbrial chaperone YadV [Burkholderia pseudomultivorans]
MMARFSRRWLVLMAFALGASFAHASVTLSGTRIVFDAREKEVTLQMSNDGKRPALVQTWIDTGDERASPESLDVPFVIAPSIFRIEAGKGQTLRIMHTGEPLPTDKESLFWLNVLDVPPKATVDPDANRLQLAFRTRVKLMYRPSGLPGEALDAPSQLKWRIVARADRQAVLEAINPTPYVVNLSGIALVANGKTFDAGVGFVRPGETASFPVKGSLDTDVAGGKVVYSSMDDWGASHAHQSDVAK